MSTQNKTLHATFFLTHTAESNGAIKTHINNFKMRDKALKIFNSLLTAGNGGEDPLPRWNMRPGFVVQVLLESKDSKPLQFKIA